MSTFSLTNDIFYWYFSTMERKKFTTTLRIDLLKKLKKLAIDEDKRANILLEEAIEWLLKKYSK